MRTRESAIAFPDPVILEYVTDTTDGLGTPFKEKRGGM